MRTRSKRSLAHVPFSELGLPPPTRKRKQIERKQIERSADDTVGRFLLLDVEATRIQTDGTEVRLLPVQVAWNTYDWYEGTRRLVPGETTVAYVSELVCQQRFREQLIPGWLSKHEREMQRHGFPMRSAAQVLEQLVARLTQERRVLVAYNASWDLRALGDLARTFAPQVADVRPDADNPFHRLGVRCLDLMRATVKCFGRELVASGIADGTIARSGSGAIRMKSDRERSVYNAAYVLRTFFNLQQEHLADKDVEHEALLLGRLLTHRGLHNVELGSMEPQETSYQIIERLARESLRAHKPERRPNPSCMFIPTE